MLLDKKFRSELEKRYAEEKRVPPPEGIIPFPPTNRFETLLTQRHVQVRPIYGIHMVTRFIS